MDETLRQLGELLLGSVPTVILVTLLYILYTVIVHKPLRHVLEQRRSKLGDFEWNVCTSFAGMPFKDVEASMRLLAKEVLPEVKNWGEDSFEPVRASA